MSSEDSNSIGKRLNWTYDLFWSMLNLCVGRVYPSLRPYLPQSSTHLANKHAIITGANSGIGFQIAKDLTHLGATVTLACRNLSKGQEAVDEILKLEPDARDRVHLRKLDTSSLASVRDFVAQSAGSKVDILMNNAGIVSLPPGDDNDFSPDGLEMIYATNFLGSFLLTHLLEPQLSSDARVVFTTSTGQYSAAFSNDFSESSVKNSVESGFHVPSKEKFGAVALRYGMTKSMQCAFARCLQAKWDNDAAVNGNINHRVAHSFSPGFTATPIFGKFELKSFISDPVFWLLQVSTIAAMTPSEGAAPGTWLASTDDKKVVGEGQGGAFWERLDKRLSTADMLDRRTLNRLWTRWEADAGVQWR